MKCQREMSSHISHVDISPQLLSICPNMECIYNKCTSVWVDCWQK